ncbi:metallophosphoesterase family protein [Kallotenue papyrolyticum]|uniref:metallophosphoesterase family protein n=1 Tax=Kallotenue papyrolyticum TaxID=1325125 RepID=UPI0004AE0AAC|nr:metallophosphoesterase family protein [Kallotenue papyrolyticum]
MLIGVLSDTHGRFNPAIARHFAGVERIIHAGDIGNEAVLERLKAIAPVTAVTGNVDWGSSLDRQLPRSARLELEGCRIYVTHIGGTPTRLLEHLPEPRPNVYIFGHTHQALLEEHDGVLFLNPGSAGAPRFGLPASLALLRITQGRATAEIVPL